MINNLRHAGYIEGEHVTPVLREKIAFMAHIANYGLYIPVSGKVPTDLSAIISTAT